MYIPNSTAHHITAHLEFYCSFIRRKLLKCLSMNVSALKYEIGGGEVDELLFSKMSEQVVHFRVKIKSGRKVKVVAVYMHVSYFYCSQYPA